MHNNKEHIEKIAIFTWFNTDRNCGQTLQAYALQSELEKLGCGKVFSYIINYISYDREIYRKPILWTIVKYLKCLKYRTLIRQIKFDIFIKNNLHISPTFFRKKDVEDFLYKLRIEKLLVGSDQVWNPNAGLNDILFLKFSGNYKKYAFGPSMMSINEFEKFEDNLKQYSKSLEQFEFIGVRELTAKKILNQLINKKVEAVLDPVFLKDKREWGGVIANNRMKLELQLKEKKYLLVYFLGEINTKIKIISAVRDKYEIKEIIYIVTNEVYEVPKEWRKVKNVDPVEFISYIKNSIFVLGDSFHLAAFSIIFRKNFYVFQSIRKNMVVNMERITDLLYRMKLQERYKENYNFEIRDIDYGACEKQIMSETQNSEKIFKNMFSMLIHGN